MRRSHIQNDANGVQVNLTPLIDMVFILLIFFIVTASFVKESGIDVERPTAHTTARKERGNIIIGVTEAGEIWIDKQQTDIRMLRAHVERMKAEHPEASVVILADRETKTGIVVQAMDQARLAGVSQVSIAATSEALSAQ
jgi:biopolymer transport protein ExbD